MRIRVAAVGLILVLVCSAVVGALLVRSEVRSGGLVKKWVLSGGASYQWLQYIAMDGSIISSETLAGHSDLISVRPNGTLEWSFETNAEPYPTQGPNGGFYFIDWNKRYPASGDYSEIGWRNLTVLDSGGHFRWSYVVPNGTLDIWAIYPDGEVIAHYYDDEYNSTLGKSVTVVDKIIAISDSGSKLWSIDWPLGDASPNYPRLAGNGTFLVNAYSNTAPGDYYEIGIREDGSHLFIVGIDYYYDFIEPASSRNGTVGYEVRQYDIDYNTTLIGVYAVNLPNCSLLWNTTLHLSDNPSHNVGGYGLQPVVVGNGGIIYAGDMVGQYSYALSPDGRILWQRPYYGGFAEAYPSGGVLAIDGDSISKVSSDGSLVWKHYAHLDGYSSVLLGKNGTVYYSTAESIVALTPGSGLSQNMLDLFIIAAVDGVLVITFIVFRNRKRGSEPQ